MGNLWNTPASGEMLPKELSELTVEDVARILKRSVVGAAELDARLKKYRTKYRCCPNGCCHCRRY